MKRIVRVLSRAGRVGLGRTGAAQVQTGSILVKADRRAGRA